SCHNTPTPTAVRHMTISQRKNGRKSCDWALVPTKTEGGLSIDAVSTGCPFDGHGRGLGRIIPARNSIPQSRISPASPANLTVIPDPWVGFFCRIRAASGAIEGCVLRRWQTMPASQYTAVVGGVSPKGADPVGEEQR